MNQTDEPLSSGRRYSGLSMETDNDNGNGRTDGRKSFHDRTPDSETLKDEMFVYIFFSSPKNERNM